MKISRIVKNVLLSFFLLIFLGGVAAGCGVALLFYWASRDLPDLDRLINYDAPQATVVLARDGSILGTLSHERRYNITLKDMSRYLPMAFLAVEDDNFYRHPGVDVVAIVRAAIHNFQRGHTGQGGSTITQQIIKQLLLTSERSYTRKMKEALLAYKLEQSLSKDEILLTYLNYIYLGQHAYGVEAAARTYFGKHASDLTLAECAVIAGLPQAPSAYNPFRHPEAAQNRQRHVLERMRVLQWISEEEYQQAIAEPLVYWSMPDGRDGAAEWYLEEARRLLIEFFTERNLAALGIKTPRYGEDYVYEAGLTVQTAMDPVQQDAAGAALRQGLEELDKRQGWRGPITHLSSADQKAFLDKSDFTPENLLGNRWAKALVTDVAARSVQVALGKGYTGVIPLANMSWARKATPRSSGGSVGDARQVVKAGDVIWVSAADATVTVTDPKTKKKRRETSRYDSAQVRPGTPITLKLQQIPEVQGALASIEPQSGDVVALIGGYQFGNSHFNRATQARRQPGSSFKPIVYSAALDLGFTPTSELLDGPFVYVNPQTNEVWRPSNYEGSYKGILPLHRALALSRNTTTVRVASTIGIENVIHRAKSLGLEPNFPAELAICLGAVDVTPLNLTQAYAAFANNGMGVRPRIITSIKDAEGRELYRQNPEHWQAISPQNAYQMAQLLKEVVNAGTGGRARVPGYDNIGGKTGTTNEERDAWFVGFSPYLATGVYVGFDQVRSLGRGEQGGRTAAPIFRYYRTAIEDRYKDSPQDYTMPPGITMVDGLAFQGEAIPGISAVDGSEVDGSAEGGNTDTSSGGEALMRQMF